MKIKAGVCRFSMNDEKNINEYIINDEVVEVKKEEYPKKKNKAKRVAIDYEILGGFLFLFKDAYGYLLKEDIKKDAISQAIIKEIHLRLTEGQYRVLCARVGRSDTYQKTYGANPNTTKIEENTKIKSIKETTFCSFAPAEFGFSSGQWIPMTPDLTEEMIVLYNELSNQKTDHTLALEELKRQKKGISNQERRGENKEETQTDIWTKDFLENEYEKEKQTARAKEKKPNASEAARKWLKRKEKEEIKHYSPTQKLPSEDCVRQWAKKIKIVEG